jgi:hypothetical protein
VTVFPVVTPGSAPYKIAAGPDGNLWFSEYVGGGRVARVTSGLPSIVAPLVAGTGEIGLPLACEVGIWSPLPYEVSRQWLSDDQPLADETGPVYVPQSADLGHQVSCLVTAQLVTPGLPAVLVSSDSASNAVTIVQAGAGPPGASGPTGPDGAGGQDGASGPAGAAGAAGASGATGSTGPSGPQGAIAASGSQGATGPVGPQGAIAASGPQGATGPVGPQGASGLTRSHGETCPARPPRVVLALAATSRHARAGAIVRLRYAATHSTTVIVELRRGHRLVLSARARAHIGANTLVLRLRRGHTRLASGTYVLSLRSKTPGALATSLRLTLTR